MKNSQNKLVKVILMQPTEYHKLITNTRGEEIINRKFLPIICNSKLSDFDKWIKIRQELNYFVYKKKKRGIYTENKIQPKSSSFINNSTQTYYDESNFDEKPVSSKKVKILKKELVKRNINSKSATIFDSVKDIDKVLSSPQDENVIDSPQNASEKQTKRTLDDIDDINAIDDIGMNTQPSKRRHIQKKIQILPQKRVKPRIFESEVNLRNLDYITGREKLRRSSRQAGKKTLVAITPTEDLGVVRTPPVHKEKTQKPVRRTKPYQIGKNKINWIALR